MAQNNTVQIKAAGNASAGSKHRVFWVGLILVALIVVVIFAVAYHAVQKAEKEFKSSSLAEMEMIAFNRHSEVKKWLDSINEQSLRFANSKIISDFAHDVDELSGDLNAAISSGEGSSVAGLSNISLLQSYLTNFISYSDFDFGSMLNSRGEMYITTDPAFQTLSTRQRATVGEVVKEGHVRMGPVTSPGGKPLQLEVYVPVTSIGDDGKSRVVAVLFMNYSAGPKLRELLNLEGYASQGYNILLLQRVGDVVEQVDFKGGRLREMPAPEIGPDGEIAFAERKAIGGNKRVYSHGVSLSPDRAWLVLELDYAQARAYLDSRISDYYKLAALGALVLVLLISAIWRWFISLERSQTLARFQELFALIDDQKRLLNSINSAIAEPICLTNKEGKFLYVNQAFADAFGRDAEGIVGLDTAAVYGFDTARRLNVSDQHTLMTGENVTIREIIWLQSKRHYFQISKAPLRDSDSQNIIGIVAVFRDVTRLVEAEDHSHRMVQQTIDALVLTIEEADPFLGGHSRIMGEVATLIGKGLNLSEKDIATIETAATLSQIGKMFVPRDVLTKPGALTPEEKKVMEQHVEHTLNALGKIEFDLPVLKAIAQMNERLDGKGYPEGLKEEEISVYGKVLAVANAFTAMARPRSYRSAMPVKEVLETLEKQAGTSYDTHVLEVLRGVLQTPAGEKVAARAAKSTPV